MALPDYFKTEVGTAKVWQSSGGDYGITCTSLANGSARQGAKGDLGTPFAKRWRLTLEIKLTSAGTNGNEVEVYWAGSDSATAGTGNPGNTSGTDASLSNPSEVKRQLIPVGSLMVANSLGTGVQRQVMEFCPNARYGMPVLVNNSGVAFSGAAADTIITIAPLQDSVQESV